MNIDVRYILIATLVFLCVLFGFLVWGETREARRSRELAREKDTVSGSMADIEKYRQKIRDLIEEIQRRKSQGENAAELIRQCEEYKILSITGLMNVDVLLSYKQRICNENNIECVYEIGRITHPVLQEKEYLSLLGNLIDNAIEASLKWQERKISVKAHEIMGKWTLKVSNTKSSDEHPLETGMATTKTDRENHGIGSKVVDMIVKDNKGQINRYDKGDIFEVFVSFDCKS